MLALLNVSNPSNSFAIKPLQRIVVGANLKDYSPPIKDECDITVPSQYITIQAAIDTAIDGDTVCIESGIYNEDVVVNKPIRLSGKGANKTTINGQDTYWPGTVYITSANAVVEGFSILGVGTNIAVHVDINNLTTGSILRHNWLISGHGGVALQIDRFQNNTLIQNNILEGNNSPYVARELGSTGKVDFLNNSFIGTVNPNDRSDTGITLDAGVPDSLIVRNSFNTTGAQIALITPNGTSVINENNFNDSASIKILNGWPTTVNARNNWWGDSDPSDNIRGIVDFASFATKPFKDN